MVIEENLETNIKKKQELWKEDDNITPPELLKNKNYISKY